MTGYDFDKGRKIQKLNTFETAETMPSQNRLALEHMLEYEDEPSEEFRSSLAALPVELVSNPNQFPIYKCRSLQFLQQCKKQTQKEGNNPVVSSKKPLKLLAGHF